MQRGPKHVRLVLDRIAEVGPPIDRWVEARVNGEIAGIALVGGPPGQLGRWNQPALREEGGTALLPVMKGQPKIVRRYEGVAAHVETDQVIASMHGRAFDLYEDRTWRVDQLDEEISALAVEGRPQEQQVLVVSPEEFRKHGELVHASLVDSQDRELRRRRDAESRRRSEFLP